MKVLNVFGIVLAWILSIAMVVMLIAAPLTLSALSLLEPENILELISQAVVGNNESAAAQPLEEATFQQLSVETEAATEETATAGGIKLDGIQDIVGDAASKEMLEKVLASDAMSELLSAYTKDFANVIAGKNKEKEFTPELLVKVVEENLDEITQIVVESGTPLTDAQKEQFKSQLQTSVQDKAEEIVAAMAPEELKEAMVEGNEEMELAFTVMASKNEIRGMIVGMIVLISLLIFGLRFPGLRGMRWLSANLFTAGGFNALICVALGIGTTAVKGVVAGVNAIDGTAMDGVIGTLLGQLTKGMIIRTVVIFVAAIALLVGYILLKPFVRKKQGMAAEPAAEEIIPGVGPVFVPVPATVEPEESAEEPAEEPAPAEEI